MTFDFSQVTQKPFERSSGNSNRMFDALGEIELEMH
jgi:hypothetical protein